jgi:hypothetical protein
MMLLYLIISLISYHITLTPLIPLSLKGEGEDNKKEGLPPLLNTPCYYVQ